MTIVNVLVKNDDVLNSPVVGAVVGVYDMSSFFVTQGTTDSSGLVSFSLIDPQYRIYIYKHGFSIAQPWLLEVDLTKISVTYELIGHERELPESLDPKTIRVSGFINNSSNISKKNMSLQLFHLKTLVSGEDVVSSTPVTYYSNDKGYFEFDLLRNVKYKFGYLTEQNLYNMQTPDRSAILLPHFIFPVPVLVDTETTINVPLNGGPVSVPFTCTFSDYSTNRGLRGDWGWVVPHATPENIMSYGFSKTEMTITPLEIGTTTVTFTREFWRHFQWNDPPPFVSPTVTINVI